MADQDLTRAEVTEILEQMKAANAPPAQIAKTADELVARMMPDTPSPQSIPPNPKYPHLTFENADRAWKASTSAMNSPAALASGGAALATGGLSVPLQALGQVGAGILSGGAGTLLEGGSAKDAAWNAGVDAATNLAPIAGGAALRGIAPTLMEAALRLNAPIGRKFGRDKIGKIAVAERILPTQAGADKAGALLKATSADKAALLQAADQRASILPRGIVQDAFQEIGPTYQQQVKGGGGAANVSLAGRFLGEHPQGLSPTDLNEAKVYWDDLSDAARRRAQIGGRLGASQKLPIALAKSAGRTLEDVAPGIQDLNQRIMGLKGAQLGAQGRVDIPAQGLNNLTTAFGTAAELASGNPKVAAALAATRAARLPVTMGRAALGASDMGKVLMSRGAPPTAEMIRAVIMDLLQRQQ